MPVSIGVTHGYHSSDQCCCPSEALNPFSTKIALNTIDGNDGIGTKVLSIQCKHEETEWIDRHTLILSDTVLG